MKLADATHTDQPWRIHEITGDFRTAGVWAFDAPGAGPDDFPEVVATLEAASAQQSPPIRFLFAVRWWLGRQLGWDKPNQVPSLRDRLPRDIEATSHDTDAPLSPVYDLDNECARELANKTVHGVLHLGWTPKAGGDHELRMAVLVKPNGLLGRLYMAAIAPFRHLIVYPAMTRQWERAWRGRDTSAAVGTTEVPADVQALSSLPRIDYVDLFTLTTDVDATPEQWARAMFGDVPSPGERLIWQGFLGLRLSGTRSPDTVAGWRITERGEDWLRLEAQSWFLTGNLVVRTAGERVSLATFLSYERRLGNLVWPVLSTVHRRLAPGLLPDAAMKLRERQPRP